ncbi:MAG: helix-turn-helix domain-containing protein [Waterburya sp.]
MSRPKKLSGIQESDNTFRRLRKSTSLTQENLARRLGVAVSTIRRWEKSQAEPTMTVHQMKCLCSAVNKRFEQLPDQLATKKAIGL